MRITVAVVAILALVAVSRADDPGIKARITDRGLDLVLRSAIKSAKKEVRRNPPRLSTKKQDTSFRGYFYVHPGAFYWPNLIGGSFGSASLQAVLNSHLRLRTKGAAMKIATKYGIGFLDHLYDIPISPYDISFDMNFYITGVKRIPQVTYGTCRISKVQFNETAPHLKGAYGDALNKNLEAGGCRLIGKFIKGTLNVEIERATSPATIWKGTMNNSPKVLTYFTNYIGKYLKLELMYDFAETTLYGTDYVDVYLTGDVYQDGKVTKKKFTPAAFPTKAPVNKMLYFWVSEAVYNNIFKVAHDRKIFKTKKTEIKTAAAPRASFKKSGVSFRVTCDILITYVVLGTPITKSASMEVNVNATLKLKGKAITTEVTGKSSKFNDITGFESTTPQMEAVAVKFVTAKLSPIKLPLPKYLKLLKGVITPIDVSYNMRARYGPF